MSNEFYRTSPIKRQRRTKEDIETVKRGIVEILSETESSMTVRQVFYQLSTRGYIPKTEAAYKGIVCRLLTDMRLDGTIPFGYIADNTRRVRRIYAYNSIEESLADNIRTYRRALWNRQPVYVEIWVEKDALSGIIGEITDVWNVSLMTTRGYSSISYLYEAAEYMKSTGKPVYLYYLGDYDPSGLDISRSTEQRLREFAPDVDLHFERIAVTPEQIYELDLPTRPTKQTDTRSKNFNSESVELDAIPVNILKELVEFSILQHIDVKEYENIKRIESLERESLKWVANNMMFNDDGDISITKEFKDVLVTAFSE